MSKKTIEETYKKLSQLEHIRLRPGMYVGNTKRVIEEMWVFNGEKMCKKMVKYCPAFLKIFDEALTNATDHTTRDPNVSYIKVDIDTTKGEISICNNGSGVPVVIHKQHNIYVPELIFGHLMSGSNYDDNEKRIGAGTNGLGIKLTNFFSKTFVVETVDSTTGLKFVQEYSDNMSVKSKPKITKSSLKSYTKITFIPDFSSFDMTSLDEDTVSLMSKRVYDCIAITNKNVCIYLNGNKIKGKGLQDYVNYFLKDTSSCFLESNVGKNGNLELEWEYAIVPYDKFEHVSFVNGNSTYQGGKHVDSIMYQITSKLKTLLETKKKLKDVKPAVLKERMFLFLRSTIINPSFSSQTKEYLTTQTKDFGCKIEVSDKFIDKIWKSPIIEDIVEFYKMKEAIDLKKSTDGKKKNRIFVPKLEDALWAGTSRSNQCTLILTEGDSAKTFAMWGRSIVGADKYGVYPLRGKVLNIRDATTQQLINNEELNNLKQIIGLQHEKVYETTLDLRYGKVMLLTDSDVDGSHIKGLLINFFHAQWPSLIKLDFIQTLKTPIIKAIKGKNVIEFFTEQDYNAWKNNIGNVSSYNIRYFKGLGTSQKDDAKETFKKINTLTVDYYFKDHKCDESILLAFEKDKNVKDTEIKCSDKRKAWLSKYNKNSFIQANEKKVSYHDLIHKELVHFSIYDNTRSIPSLLDGLKPSQRKILHYILDKNITKPIKVAQLSGYVSAETSYHHGEASLQQAIIGMAQNFIGTNNINLLYPDGNFGSRLLSKDAASPRYIYTRLPSITTSIFHPTDVPLLNFLNDDGQQIEPEWYIPVIPMILINGCEGIGTGYSTYIPPHNPKDVIANILRLLDDKEPLPMKPFFKDFKGDIIETENGFTTKGKWTKKNDTQIEITELPIGTWVTPYKEFLESLIDSNQKKEDKKKKKFLLKDVQNNTKDENTEISFVVEFKNKSDLQNNLSNIEKELKLAKSFSTNNMYLFDDNLVPSRYKNTQDILLDFYDIRLEFYAKRKTYLIQKLTSELNILKAKVRFINDYISENISIHKQTRENIVKQLDDKQYLKIDNSYDYLVKMPIIALTLEKITELENQMFNKQKELDNIVKATDKDLWKQDLDNILKLI